MFAGKMYLCENNFEKPYTEKRKLNNRLVVIHYLQVVRRLFKKQNMIVTEIETVWIGFVGL